MLARRMRIGHYGPAKLEDSPVNQTADDFSAKFDYHGLLQQV